MVAVIGAGITGLCLAYFLNLKGHDVTVIEKDERLGGNCAWINLGEFIVDNFYHVITGQDNYFLNWVDELGIADKLFPVKIRVGFYKKGKIYPISTPKEFLFFPPLSITERIRLGTAILRAKMIHDWKNLDTITASEWLSCLCGKSTYQKLWHPVMKSKFGPVTDEIVATDMWFRINRMSGIRNKKFKQDAYSIKGSLKTFFDKLEEKLKIRNVNIIKGVGVNKIKAVKKCVKSVVLDNQEEIYCDKVIAAVPIPDFVGLLPEGCGEYSRGITRIKYLNNICLILRLKERFSEYYMINLGEDGFPFTGIIGADALYPPDDFGGGHILYISKYFLGESEFLRMDKHEILKRYLPYLRKICPRFEENWILDIALTKKRNVEAVHSLNYASLIPSYKTPLENLYLLDAAQIYPEPTVLDASVKYAKMLVNNFFNSK